MSPYQIHVQVVCGDGAAVLKLWTEGGSPTTLIVPDGRVAHLDGWVRDLYIPDDDGRPSEYLIYDGFPHAGRRIVCDQAPSI